jgi:hypothetical protein
MHQKHRQLVFMAFIRTTKDGIAKILKSTRSEEVHLEPAPKPIQIPTMIKTVFDPTPLSPLMMQCP